MEECPLCDGPLVLLGVLGQRVHCHCRNCGADCNYTEVDAFELRRLRRRRVEMSQSFERLATLFLAMSEQMSGEAMPSVSLLPLSERVALIKVLRDHVKNWREPDNER